ncbi:hypothetical protein DFH06DRAFT_453379 [Mycena polygramma]|nr:hypothetical protein DFH06DRAFT_453379 [Mycena polygramma]
MIDPEKDHRRQRSSRREQDSSNVTRTPAVNHDEDGAAAKLWAVYAAEAEKYDGSLVETWKSDMEGLLIFAALFSAILTAFIIESYKSLTPDAGDLAVHLLGQISQQLAASANASSFHATPPSPFKPAVTSLICNALWFMSLGFSLACALTATLIQQWTRDFLHKADMRSAPTIRARIFSFLYYGLKRFQMHTVVEVIPLLLHASLLLFFCGLVAFLIPVNAIMTVIAAALLVIVAAAYLALTVLPLRYLDCPYQTPLSGTFWRILQGFKKLRLQHRTRSSRSPTECAVETDPDADSLSDEDIVVSPMSTDETMVEAMSRTAMECCNERLERDHRALVWTMKSLSNDIKLEPFIEAIPGVLWGPTDRRESYESHIQCLLRDPDVQLLACIQRLLASCDKGILSPGVSQRRTATCWKALWAIANLLACNRTFDKSLVASDFSRITSSSIFRDDTYFRNEEKPYATSVSALMALSAFMAYQSRLVELRDRLLSCEADESQQRGHLKEVAEFYRITDRLLRFGIPNFYLPYSPSILDLRLRVEQYLSESPCHISLRFFSKAARFDFPPYRFNETCSVLRRYRIVFAESFPVHDWVQDSVQASINALVSTHMKGMETARDVETTPDWEWYDGALSELLSFWQPLDTDHIPRAIIVFLNEREHDSGLQHVFLHSATNTSLWKLFPRTLSEGASVPPFGIPRPAPLLREDLFTALWRLAYIHLRYTGPPDYVKFPPRHMHSLQSVLKAVSNAESHLAHIISSIIALLKIQMLRELEFNSSNLPLGETCINYGLFPNETAIQTPDELHDTEGLYVSSSPKLSHQISEAEFVAGAQYLECCTSDVLPYEAVKTWTCLIRPRGPIHATHQLQLANSIHTIFAAAKYMELLAGIVDSACWDIYTAERRTTAGDVSLYYKDLNDSRLWPRPWLDDIIARQIIEEAFTDHIRKTALSVDSRHIMARLRDILQGIRSWHGCADSSQHSGNSSVDSNMSH